MEHDDDEGVLDRANYISLLISLLPCPFCLSLSITRSCSQESESIVELKNVLGVTSLPAGTLALGSEGIKKGKKKSS